MPSERKLKNGQVTDLTCRYPDYTDSWEDECASFNFQVGFSPLLRHRQSLKCPLTTARKGQVSVERTGVPKNLGAGYLQYLRQTRGTIPQSFYYMGKTRKEPISDGSGEEPATTT